MGMELRGAIALSIAIILGSLTIVTIASAATPIQLPYQAPYYGTAPVSYPQLQPAAGVQQYSGMHLPAGVLTQGNGLVSATPIQLPYPRPDPIQGGTGTGIGQYNPAIASRGSGLVSATPIQLPYPRPEPLMRGGAGQISPPVRLAGRNDPVSATPIQLP